MDINTWRLILAEIVYRLARPVDGLSRSAKDFGEGRIRGMAEALAMDATQSTYPNPEVIDLIVAEARKLPYAGLLRIPEAEARAIRRSARRLYRQLADEVERAAASLEPTA